MVAITMGDGPLRRVIAVAQYQTTATGVMLVTATLDCGHTRSETLPVGPGGLVIAPAWHCRKCEEPTQ